MSVSAGSLDANILLRLILKDVPKQHAAAVALIRTAKAPLFVANTAFIEAVFVLGRNYKLQRPQIVEAIEGLLDIKVFFCERLLLHRALLFFLDHSALSFEDCCLAAYAEIEDAVPLWTFDRKLAKKMKSARLLPLRGA